MTGIAARLKRFINLKRARAVRLEHKLKTALENPFYRAVFYSIILVWVIYLLFNDAGDFRRKFTKLSLAAIPIIGIFLFKIMSKGLKIFKAARSGGIRRVLVTTAIGLNLVYGIFAIPIIFIMQATDAVLGKGDYIDVVLFPFLLFCLVAGIHGRLKKAFHPPAPLLDWADRQPK